MERGCLSDDDIDEYVLNRISAEEKAVMDLHFIECQACMEAVKQTMRFVQGLRRAAKRDGLTRLHRSRTSLANPSDTPK
jgi:anti-sigma factor RsiW